MITTTTLLNNVIDIYRITGEGSHLLKDAELMFNAGIYQKMRFVMEFRNADVTFYFEGWKINMKEFIGRCMTTFIHPDGDWLTFCGDAEGDKCGLHGIHHEDGDITKWDDIMFKLHKLQKEDFVLYSKKARLSIL